MSDNSESILHTKIQLVVGGSGWKGRVGVGRPNRVLYIGEDGA
jgi:hypothetical protein